MKTDYINNKLIYFNDEGKKIWILNILTTIYFGLVKWIIYKPISTLSYMINGRMELFGKKAKWYERKYTHVRNRTLHNITYKLAKHLMFQKLI